MSEKALETISYLPTCSDSEVGNFELSWLAEVSNIRKEMLAMFDRMVDQSAFAVLAAWLRTIDRQELKRKLLQSPDAKIKEILEQTNQQIRNQGHEEEEAGPIPSPWGLVRTPLPPGESRKRYTERNLAEGKCERCSRPLDLNSVRYCTEHLKEHRRGDTRYRQKQGARISLHGRHPNTLKALRKANEERKRRPSDGHACRRNPSIASSSRRA